MAQSEYSVSTSQSAAAAKKAAKEAGKKIDPSKLDTTLNPVATTLFSGGGEYGDKFTAVAFHPVLPWLAMMPKHGSRVVVWDTDTGKQVTVLPLTSLLTAQHPNPSAQLGVWSDSHCGKNIAVFLVDEGGLLWQRYLQLSNVSAEYADDEDIGAPSELFGCSGPSYDALSKGAEGPAVDPRASVLPQADASESGEGAGGDVAGNAAAVVVMEHVALVVSVGTGAILEFLPSSAVHNRVFTTAVFTPVVSASRLLVLIGCQDGTVVSWDPFCPESPKYGVITTPHSSKLTSIVPVYVVAPPKASNAEADPRGSVFGSVNNDFDLMKSTEGFSGLNGAQMAFMIGTDGGSITKLRMKSREEAEAEFVTKKIHDSVISMCATPRSEAERHATHPGLMAGARPSEVQALLDSLSRSVNIISLGSQFVVMQDASTGAEMRRIKVKGMNFVQLMPAPGALFLVTSEAKHFTADYSLTWDQPDSGSELRLVFDLNTNLTQAAQPEKMTKFVPFHGTRTLEMTPPAGVPDKSNIRTYTMVQHPARRAIKFAFCTNRGLFMTDCMHAMKTRVTLMPVKSSASAMATMAGGEADVGSRTATFLVTENGKLSSLKLNTSPEVLLAENRSRLLVPLIAEFRPQADVLASQFAHQNTFVGDRSLLVEPEGGKFVSAVVPSPCNELLLVITNTRDVMLLEARRGFDVVTLPVLNKADSVAWSSNSTSFAVLSLDTKKICVAKLRRITPNTPEAAAFQVSPNTHEVHLSNVPVGISGGRWLCVHFEAAFSGLSSQFYRWEPSNAGGGAVGGFIPQPKQLHWDSSGTLCALVYSASVVFMRVKRKMWSMMASVDLSSEPTDAKFYKRSLIVVFENEILLLLPTEKTVQKVLVASINPAVTNRGSSTLGARAMFSYRVALRPVGRLLVLGVLDAKTEGPIADAVACKGYTATIVLCDDQHLIYFIPLTLSVAQLLCMIQEYPFESTDNGTREVVQSCLAQVNHLDSSTAVFSSAVIGFAEDIGIEVEGVATGNGTGGNAVAYELIANEINALSAMEAAKNPSVGEHRRLLIEKVIKAISGRIVGSWVAEQEVLNAAIKSIGGFARAAEKRKELSEGERLRAKVLNDLVFDIFTWQERF